MKRYPGVVTATVKSLEDPDGQGRIELVFPWMSETNRSAWAPVATGMAGKERGMYFMPEKDDEVLVAFEQGDFDHPFIVGFLWNGVDTPPEATNQNRVIVTPGGHTLRFEDGEGQKKIILRSSGGHEIVLDDATASRSVKVCTSGKQSLELDDVTNSVTLSGGGRIVKIESGGVTIL